ncbi:hypothetical protein J6590_003821 [Homalodisca vitripennis]|nr:hypothetical protein J6590_003821 [Homalodisca vitripennis]
MMTFQKRNQSIARFEPTDEERPRFVYPLYSASLTFPSTSQLIVQYRGANCQLEIVGDTALLLEWHSCICAHIKEWKTKRRLSILFSNRMRLTHACKLDSVTEDTIDSPKYVRREKERWRPAGEKMEGVHRLRELSLMSEEERCPWSSLPEVTAKKCAEHLSEEQLQSYQLLLDLVVGEVVYNQELSRLVDLARASVRWKDSLPLFNRRSIIACSLRVKKCSDALVRTLEEEWSKPQSLVTDLSRTFSILEASFDAKAAQTYVAYCDNLDDARTLFRRATQRESGLMSSVVSARCHIECALLPIQRLSQLRTVLERIRRILPADDGNQRLLQCQQLFVTISGIIELCYKVLTSLHGSSYLADIDNMLDFSNKLSTLRLRRHRSSGGQQREEVERDVSSRPRLPLPDEAGPDTCAQPQEMCQETLSPEQTGNLYSPTPTLKPKTNGAVMPQEELNGSFNLIDLRSLENLLIETKVDSGSSLESGPSSSSGLGSPGGDYELIELKELTTKRWSGDGQLLQKSFEEQPLYQEYNEALDTCSFDTKAVWEYKNALIELVKENRVTLGSVSGPEGIHGNEKADTLAKKGSRQNSCKRLGKEDKTTLTGVARSELCRQAEESAEHIWLNCPAISKIRKRFLEAYLLSPKDIREQEPSNLIGFC